MLKSVLTPQLYSALLEWATWMQKALKAIPPTDYNAQLMIPVSDNPFFGESDQTGDSVSNETIAGDTATVTATAIKVDTDGASVLRRTTNTFYFVRKGKTWLISDVQRVSSAFPDWKPMQSDLLVEIKKETAKFKKQARK